MAGSLSGGFVHRLVADAFLGPIPHGRQVNHKNGIKHDNRLENLEVVSNAENRAHSYRVLGIAPNRVTGANNVNAKLDWDKVDAIRAAYAKGGTITELGRQYAVTKQCISAVVKGRVWREADRPPHP